MNLLNLLFVVICVNGCLRKKDLDEIIKLNCAEYRVTLNVYSTELNPSWKMNLSEMIKIKNLIKQNENKTFEMKQTKRIIGYQGFSISCSKDKQIFVNNLIYLEKEFLKSGLSYLPSEIIDHVNKHIGECQPINVFKKSLSFNCDNVPIKGPDNVPKYNPQTDNGGCFITKQRINNCYAYGNLHLQHLSLNQFCFLF
jgi:hypothetical protein